MPRSLVLQHSQERFDVQPLAVQEEHHMNHYANPPFDRRISLISLICLSVAAAIWLQIPINAVNSSSTSLIGTSIESEPKFSSSNSYGQGESIIIDVSFNNDVTVSGTPSFRFRLGSETRDASYASGSGTSTLTFAYEVLPSDLDTDGIEFMSNAIALNVTDAIFDVDTREVAVAHKLPATGFVSGIQRNHLVSGSAFFVAMQMSVPEIPANYEEVSIPITIDMKFNGTVFVTGTPYLEVGHPPCDSRVAHYFSGSGTDQLEFSYVVGIDDVNRGQIQMSNPTIVLEHNDFIRDENHFDAIVPIRAASVVSQACEHIDIAGDHEPKDREVASANIADTDSKTSITDVKEKIEKLQQKYDSLTNDKDEQSSTTTELQSNHVETEANDEGSLIANSSFDSLQLSWHPVDNAGGYSVQWRETDEEFQIGGIREAIIDSGSTTTYTIENLNPSTTYGVKVSPFFGANYGTRSEETEIRTTNASQSKLKNLRLDDSRGRVVKLNPSFSSTGVRYSAKVPPLVSWVSLIATAIDFNAEIEFLDNNGKTITDAVANRKGLQIALNHGANTFEIRVTSPDGTTKSSYTLSVDREIAQPIDFRENLGSIAAAVTAVVIANQSDDADATPNLRIDNVAVLESSTSADFTITSDIPLNQTVTLRYATVDGTATSGSDYEDSSGSATIRSGQLSTTISIPITQDQTDEPDESFTISITGVEPKESVKLLNDNAKSTITDDDDAPNLSIEDITVRESSPNATFTVELNHPSSRDISFRYGTADDTAIAGVDYSTTSGSASIEAGMTTTTFTVPISQDATYEPDESFEVQLSDLSPSDGATFARSSATGTITDDDGTPSISIQDATVQESAQTATFKIELSHPSSRDISFRFGTADDTAVAGSDYSATTGSASIIAGTTETTLTVPIQQDIADELDESFSVVLSDMNPSDGATFARSSATGTITDDDGTPSISIQDATVQESAQTATFKIELSHPSSRDISFRFGTADDTAVAGSDYSATTGSASIIAGTTETTLTVPIQQDIADELDESFSVVLSDMNPSDGATFARSSATGTITDDDGTPSISIQDATVQESAQTATFKIELSHPSSRDISFRFGTADDTAVAGSDYSATTGSASIIAGTTETTLTVPIQQDIADELDESFSVVLSDMNPSDGATFARSSATGTITDDDGTPSISIQDATVQESAQTATFKIELSHPSSRDISFRFGTADDTAVAGSDYSATTGSASIIAGTTEATLTVPIQQDIVDELDESFSVVLSDMNPSDGATFARGMAIGTITDDDETPELTVSDVSISESGETATFTVTLSGPSSREIDVSFSTKKGTALPGIDYVATSGDHTIPALQTTTKIAVPILQDDIDEPNEEFMVSFRRVMPYGSASIADSQGEATIVDDDETPKLHVNDVVVSESDGTATFEMYLIGMSSKSISFEYTAMEGTAIAGSDYQHTSGSMTIEPGETSVSIPVNILQDSISEQRETFELLLRNTSPINSVILSDSRATATIIDDEDIPRLSIRNVMVSESSKEATITVRLTGASSRNLSMNFETSDGTATAGSDYIAKSGSKTIPAGATSTSFKVSILRDTNEEPSENFTVSLSNIAPNDAVIAVDTSALVTIIDDDQDSDPSTPRDDRPSLSIGDVTVSESSSNAAFTISLSKTTDKAISVNYATANGTAVAGSDFTTTSGSARIAAGETVATFSVPILEDTIPESMETFSVNLSNVRPPDAATIQDGSAQATITDNDQDEDLPSISIANVSVAESAAVATLMVTMSDTSDDDVAVSFATANGTAIAGSDYTRTTGTATIEAGQSSTALTVPILNDTVVEDDESFAVNLSNVNPANSAFFTSPSATVTIESDDVPNLRVEDVVVAESAGRANFTVSLDRPSFQAVSVSYATSDATATAGADYTSSSGTATIQAGSTSTTFAVPIINDSAVEDDETFVVTLNNVHPRNTANITDSTAIATITSGDTPTISIADVTVGESDGSANFTVTLRGLSYQDISVSYSTSDDTATASADYTAFSGTVTIDAGLRSTTISVPILQDTLVEDDETFTVTLSDVNPSGAAVILQPTARGTIQSDDSPLPRIRIADIRVSESIGNATFTVTLSESATQTVSVDFATEDGTAKAGSDYTTSSGTATISSGLSSATFTVSILNDTIVEDNETFTVTLSNVSPQDGADIAKASATVTIESDDVPNLSIADVTVSETDGSALLTISMDKQSHQDVSVNYATSNGTAIIGSDYSATNGEATITTGDTSATFTVPILDDVDVEDTETFTVTISGVMPVNAAQISVNTATVSITSADTPTLSISNVTVFESSGSATFTATLSRGSYRDVSFEYSTTNGTATAGSDYTQTTASATVIAGQTSITFSVPIEDDEIVEQAETFTLTLRNVSPSGAADIGVATATATISDNDIPSLSIASVTVEEGDSSASLTVTIDKGSYQDISVSYTTSNGTALSASDYTASSSSATITAGNTSVSLSVPILDDNVVEATEVFIVTLSNVVPQDAASTAQAIATVTITDDDVPSLSISDITVSESVGNASLTVTMNKESFQSVSVNYSTQDGTATSSTDYTSGSGSVTISAGQTSTTISVPITNDSTAEVSESFTVTLGGVTPSGAADLIVATATVTITDNDIPTLSIANLLVSESVGNATLTVTLNNPHRQDVSVDYATTDGSATSGSDYTAVSDSVTIDATHTTATFNVPILNDNLNESEESFTVTISNVSPSASATISTDTATVTISDDDADVRTVSIDDNTVTESEDKAMFTVSLDQPTDEDVTVEYETADDTATAGQDYTPMQGSTTIEEGKTESMIEVPILQDTEEEDDETFMVKLKNVFPTEKARIEKGVARATILNDDLGTGICDRTPEVVDQILMRLEIDHSGIVCSQVTPEMLETIRGIQLIELSYTGISALKPGDFLGLENLESLYINGQPITNLFAGIFDGLTNVKEMWLFKNDISNVAPGAFRNMAKLKSINLEENNVNLVQSGVFANLPELERINLQDNQIPENIPWDDFEALPKLKFLSLAGNPGFENTGRVYVTTSNLSVRRGETGTYSVRFGASPEVLTPELEAYIESHSDDTTVTVAPERLTFRSTNWFRLQQVTVSVDQNAPLDQVVITLSTHPKQDMYHESPHPQVTINVLAAQSMAAIPHLQTVSISDAPDEKGWLPGTKIEITYSFTSVIDVLPPHDQIALAVTIGAEPRYASYKTGSGTSKLVFTYNTTEDESGVLNVRVPQNSLKDFSDRIKTTTGKDVVLNHSVVQRDYSRNSTGGLEVTPILTVTGGQSMESDESTVVFRMSLDKNTSKPVSVGFVTEDLSAVAGHDYESTAGTHTFAPGETEAQVSVPVFVDSTYEGTEIFALHLTDPQGIELQTQAAIGTIYDDTETVSTTLLTSIGISLVDQILDVINEQLDSERKDGFSVQSPLAGFLQEPAEGRSHSYGSHSDVSHTETTRHLDQVNFSTYPQRAYSPSFKSLLNNSEFMYSVEDKLQRRWSIWGQTLTTHFVDSMQGNKVSGQLTTAVLGIDYGNTSWTIGTLFALTDADGESGSTSEESVSSRLLSVVPYVSAGIGERTQLVTVAGWITGEANTGHVESSEDTNDIRITMFSPSLETRLNSTRAEVPLTVSLKSEILYMRVTSLTRNQDAERSNELSRYRLTLAGKYKMQILDDMVVTPSLGLGMRYDENDFAPGMGVDVVGAVNLSSTELGLTASFKGRSLVVHEADSFQRQSFTGSLTWRPSSSLEMGPFVLLEQSTGQSLSTLSGNSTEFATLSGSNNLDHGKRNQTRLSIGYTVPLLNPHWIMRPEFVHDSSQDRRDYSLGWSLLSASTGDLLIKLRTETGWREDLLQDRNGMMFQTRLLVHW